MTLIQRVVLLGLVCILLLAVLELIRRRQLREQYALLWVGTALAVLAFVIVPSVLFTVAEWLTLDHIVLMVFVCFLFVAAIVLHYSVVISKHTDCERTLVQEVALLKEELAALREQVSRQSPPQG
jgi:hypothetical protein